MADVERGPSQEELKALQSRLSGDERDARAHVSSGPQRAPLAPEMSDFFRDFITDPIGHMSDHSKLRVTESDDTPS